jgi:hypothetical protein
MVTWEFICILVETAETMFLRLGKFLRQKVFVEVVLV